MNSSSHPKSYAGRKAAVRFLLALAASFGLCAGSSLAPIGRTDIAKWSRGRRAAVSLTFDDGSINQFRVAVPIMDKLGLTATFHIITGEISGSRYRAAFIGRPVEAIIRETAEVPTDAKNFFERASAIGHLGLAGTLEFHTRAGGLYEEGKADEAYRVIDEGFAGVRGGKFVPESQADADKARLSWEGIRALADRGYEFSSHTVTHPYLSILDEANLAYELEKSRQEILDHLGPRHTFTVECPYGTEDPRVVARALALYPASRNRLPEPFLDEIDRGSDKDLLTCTREYVQWQRGVVTKTSTDLMRSWIDTIAHRDNAWLVLVFHGVDGVGWEPVSGRELEDYFSFIKAREDVLWVTTFQNAVKYMRERMHSRVQFSREGQAIKLVLRHDLDSAIYDFPLTLRTYVPADWMSVEVRQGSRVASVATAQDDIGNFVLYEAVPNTEPIGLRGAPGASPSKR